MLGNGKSGFADVSAATNGKTGLLVELQGDQKASAHTFEWMTAGYITGAAHGRLRTDRRQIFDLANYARSAGVVRGENTFSVRIERYHGIHLGRVEILSGSGVYRTIAKPPHIRLTVERQPLLRRFEVGDQVTVRYRVRNEGDIPARNVRVGLIYPRGTYKPTDTALNRFKNLTGEKTGVFRLQTVRPGRAPLTVGVMGPSNRPNVSFNLPVSAKSESNGWQLLSVGASAIAVLLLVRGVISLVLRHRDSDGKSPQS